MDGYRGNHVADMTQWGSTWDRVLRAPDTWNRLHGCHPFHSPFKACEPPKAMLCVFFIASHLQHLSAQGPDHDRCWMKVCQMNKLLKSLLTKS